MRYKSLSRRVFNAGNIIFMCILMCAMLFPYLHILAKALNDGADSARGGIFLWPRMFTLDNFVTVVTDKAFPKALAVSIYSVVCGTLIALTVQFMAAYAFLKRDLVGRSAILLFFVFPMYFSGGLIPTYLLFSKIKMLNNYLVYVLPGCFSMYNTIIIRSYLRSLPESLMEAARLDGASEMKILVRVVVPLSMPILATVALWHAVGEWSNWTTSLYYITKRDMWNLQYLLVQILKESEAIQAMLREAAMHGEEIGDIPTITSESIKCAQIIVTSIPIIMVYPFLQKYFIKGVTIGAVKD